jgi:hypothetical protein
MAQPVWILSVDLQTKTATFQTGLADAAKAARGSFSDIKGGAGDMGGAVNYNMREARHSVMLLTEEFGIHLPRALTSFIAGLGPIGGALEAAFPFLAIAVGATLLLEHLAKLHQAGEKLTDDQLSFGTAAQNAFNALDEKILESEIKADELKGDHLGALKLQLELIDKQSMSELVHSFDVLAKAADVVMKDLQGHWYTFGIGSDGAKHALEQFQGQYASMLAQGKDSDASNLLQGTLDTARKILAAQQAMKAGVNTGSTDHSGEAAQYNEVAAAHITLQKAGVGWTEKEIAAQQQLVDVLNDQVGVENRVATLQQKQGQNIQTADAKKDGTEAAEKLRKAAELQERLEREMAENVKRGEQDAVDATEAGTTERLAALQHAMDTSRALYGEGSEMYKGFAREYLKTEEGMYKQLEEISRKSDEEELEQQAAMGREEADNIQKLGELKIAVLRQQYALEDSARRESAQRRIAEDTDIATQEYANKMEALLREEAALDKSGKDYLVKLRAIQDKETQLTREHENELAAIKDKAEEESNRRILAAKQQFDDSIASGLTKSIMGHQTWSKMVLSLGQQVVSGMIENAIKSMIADDIDKERDAAHAARKAWNIGVNLGGPAGMILGPVFAAEAFTAVMAFAAGTDRVPGVGNLDTVPAMLTPGEGVVPKGVMEGLSNMARNGSMGSTTHVTNVQVRPVYNVNTIDGDGMQDTLNKHTDQLTRHIESTVRRMNR